MSKSAGESLGALDSVINSINPQNVQTNPGSNPPRTSSTRRQKSVSRTKLCTHRIRIIPVDMSDDLTENFSQWFYESAKDMQCNPRSNQISKRKTKVVVDKLVCRPNCEIIEPERYTFLTESLDYCDLPPVDELVRYTMELENHRTDHLNSVGSPRREDHSYCSSTLESFKLKSQTSIVDRRPMLATFGARCCTATEKCPERAKTDSLICPCEDCGGPELQEVDCDA